MTLQWKLDNQLQGNVTKAIANIPIMVKVRVYIQYFILDFKFLFFCVCVFWYGIMYDKEFEAMENKLNLNISIRAQNLHCTFNDLYNLIQGHCNYGWHQKVHLILLPNTNFMWSFQSNNCSLAKLTPKELVRHHEEAEVCVVSMFSMSFIGCQFFIVYILKL